MSEETCDRCGLKGLDRRTIWMACLYEMNELGLPLKQVQITGHFAEQIGTKEVEFFGRTLTVPVYGDPREDEHNYQFYILTVCKRCRGEWMAAQKSWFYTPPEGEDHDSLEIQDPGPGTGVFIRENGVTREVTHDEFQRLRPGQTPVRVKDPTEP